MTRSINDEYARRLRAIRPFVNFDFDLRSKLTAAQKRKITIYYNEVEALTHRPYHVYKPKSKKRLKAAQNFAQHDKSLPGLKVAFVPVSNPDKAPKIRFNKRGEMIVKTDYVSTRHIPLDPLELVKDAAGHVEQAIKSIKTADRFQILAGKYEIPHAYGRKFIGREVAKLVVKYADADKNNYFGNWLIGVNVLHFDNQDNVDDYLAEKSKSRAAIKRKKRAERARRYRKNNK